LQYLHWLAAHIRAHGVGVFAICFGKDKEIAGWIHTILQLGHEAKLEDSEYGIERFDPGLLLLWVLYQ
jgi:hypothetical protein